jgi:gamma-glutamyltranspeptidase / glutathione hydrolase
MFTTRPEILGTFGVVASTHWIASAVGMSILERGGNAFDAGVATGFALQVVEPHLNGPGGEVPIILHDARSKQVKVICGQGVSPAAATIERYRGMGLDMVPGTGLLAATVPGSFDAWMVLLRDYGTMKLADVLGPAIAIAREGYPLVPNIVNTISTMQPMFETEWKSSAAIYLPGGAPPKPFSLFRNSVMSATYARVLREAEQAGGGREAQIDAARKIWYRGFVAETIDRFCREMEVMDSSGQRHRGLLTGEDMARWSATIEAPLTFDYGRYTVCKCGVWSQGPALLQSLALLKGFALDATGPTDAEYIHVVTEAIKLAFADREAFYGDPNFVDVPIASLLSDGYSDMRRTLIGKTASLELRPGSIDGRGGTVLTGKRLDTAALRSSGAFGGANAAAAGLGEPTVARSGVTSGDTCHFDIVDRDGNMVSATPSGGWLQSSPVIPELGFPLGSRGQMFWLDANSPAALGPSRRPRTTLTPGLALRDGEAYLAFGTPGGDQQDQWALQLFLHHVHHKQNLQEAIDTPAFHSEHFPSSFYPRAANLGKLVLEGRMPGETVAELRRRGHLVEVGGDWSEGRLTAAAKDGPMLKAAANPRGMQGYAIGR